jgi:uncharacterized membrane protein
MTTRRRSKRKPGHSGVAGQFSLAWQRAQTSLWFLPSLLVLASVPLALGLIRVDIAAGSGYGKHWWLFNGGAEGARVVLSVIAGSLITVLAVAFSGTMIAIQQASTQFTPRVLRNFTRDRGNQVVLGTYIATFTYALLVLRRVRGDNGSPDEFVPAISITVGMALALLSLCLLVYFIHHVSESLQVTYLLRAIRRDLDEELERCFPDELGAPAHEAAPARERASEPALIVETMIRSENEGYLRRVAESALGGESQDRPLWRTIEIAPVIGDYVRKGDVVARVRSDGPLPPELECRLRSAFQLDRDRSVQQDAMFGIRQLVDIALKALSPGINDPTTAEQALDHLSGALALLLHRCGPDPERSLPDGTRVRFEIPDFSDYVEASFAQIRRAARSNLHVSRYLIEVLRKLLEQARSESHASALRVEIEEVLAGFDHSVLTRRDGEALRA